MRPASIGFALALLTASTITGCARGKGFPPSLNRLESLANHAITLRAPEVCAEGDSDFCPNWIGMRQGQVALTHADDRISFAIEDVEDDETFRLAIYPDCEMDARAATESKALKPEQGEADDVGEATKIAKSTGDDIPPLLGEGTVSVLPTGADSIDAAALARLSSSPLAACRRVVVPNPVSGEAALLVDPTDGAAAGADSRWTLYRPAEGHPVFVSTKECEDPDCLIRLVLRDDGVLTTVDTTQKELGLRSFWNKVTGSVSQGFDSLESGIADIKKTIGSTVSVAEMGGKRLVIEAATPSTRYFSAIREQGAEALSQANGQLVDGAVYLQAGASYVDQGGQYALGGAKWVVEYVENNTCYLSHMYELIKTWGNTAQVYEVALQAGVIDFYNKAAGPTSYKAQIKDSKSPVHLGVVAGVNAYALYASLSSRRFNIDEWRDMLMDIVVGAFAGNIRAGYVPHIFSKVAIAMCKGTKESLSSAHALVNASMSSGMTEDCITGIQNRANDRYERLAEDICFATRDEMNAVADAPPNSFSGDKTCPSDRNDESYLSLLESMGCNKKRFAVSTAQVYEPVVDDSVVLTHDRVWGRTNDWHAAVACPIGEVAIGMCSSGENQDCHGTAKEILCAGRPDGAVTENRNVWDIGKGFDRSSVYCPTNYAVTEFCSSGKNPDCAGKNLIMRCSPVASRYYIDYGNCTTKESKTWTGRIDSAAPNKVMVAMCTSGKYPDCGVNKDVTKSAMFCPLMPSSAHNGTHAIAAFQTSGDNLLTTNLGENPGGYSFYGAIMYLFDSPGADRTPLIRCLNPAGQHFYSTDSKCEGSMNKNEGTLGHMHKTTGSPIYRCYTNRHETWPNGADVCASDPNKAILGYAP